MLTEDGYFISKCLDGETEAFGFLVDKYKASVYAFLYSRLRNFHDAEDVTQRVFVRAYEKLGTLSSWESFARWLYTIAYSQCRNFIRECQNRPDREFVEDQNPAVLRNLSMESYRDAQVSNSLREEVEEAMASLPEMYSQILILHYFGGMRVKEIATVLSITPTNVKKRLSRARAMLKEEMLAMMDTAFEGQRLQASFTFGIVESIKRIKIRPEPRVTQVPWGLSIASGMIIAVLVIGSHLNLPHSFDATADSDSISNIQMTEASEFPVDVLETFQVTGYRGYDDSEEQGLSFQQNAALMAPHGEGGKIPENPSAQIGKGTIGGIVYAPDGKLFAAASGTGVLLYDANNLNEIALLPGPSYYCIAFSPDGKLLASGSLDMSLRLWDVEQQKEIEAFRCPSHTHSVAFTPDGETLACGIGGEGTIRIWDVKTGKQTDPIKDLGAVVSIAISPDGETLASGGRQISFWDFSEKQLLLTVRWENREIIDHLIFSPDGKWLASRGNDGTCRLWDVETGEQIANLNGHKGAVTSMSFSSGGKWLASGGQDGTILLWEVNIPVQGKSVEPTGKQMGKWGEIKETDLFQNYPNPFNPETWIPYQLGNDAHVEFSIYDSTGKMLRLVDLGHKPAGSYMDKDKAIYWDGRNEAGEPVGSGTYFIHLSADSFSSTRKMVMIR